MKKKIFYWVVVAVLLLGLCGVIAYEVVYRGDDKEQVEPVSTSTVEDLIKTDMVSMDSIAEDYTFFESRVALKDSFNVLDTFEIEEVTNVFQTKVVSGNDIITTVYMFIHNIENGTDSLDVHKDAFITDDIELYIDSIPVSFEQAFTLARQSNYVPSRSKYITLRHGFGRYECNPFYTIGNTEKGHLWVDAITGEVMDTDPSMNDKK